MIGASEPDRSGLSRTVYVARGLGILLVVLGHALVVAQMRFPDDLSLGFLAQFNSWIYSFHMHFFFFLAGWSMATFSRQSGTARAIGKRVERLLVPYAVFSAGVSLVKVMVPHLATMQVQEGAGVLSQVLLYPRDNPMSVLWFLHALFIMSVIAVLTRRGLSRVPAWVLFPVLLALQWVPTGDNLLGYKDLLIFSIPFFLGFAVPGLWSRLCAMPPAWFLVLWLVSPLVHFGLRDVIPRYPLLAITGALGIPMVLATARLVADRSPARLVSLLVLFGRYSLPVYLLSYFVEHGLRIGVLHLPGDSVSSAAFLCLDLAVNPMFSLGLALAISRLPVLPMLLFGQAPVSRSRPS